MIVNNQLICLLPIEILNLCVNRKDENILINFIGWGNQYYLQPSNFHYFVCCKLWPTTKVELKTIFTQLNTAAFINFFCFWCSVYSNITFLKTLTTTAINHLQYYAKKKEVKSLNGSYFSLRENFSCLDGVNVTGQIGCQVKLFNWGLSQFPLSPGARKLWKLKINLG